eukprot:2400455-Prymnesium_polylepis.1
MLTKSATITRACSASSEIISTHPQTASFRHISSGSHRNADVVHFPCGGCRGSRAEEQRRAQECPQATRRASRRPRREWSRSHCGVARDK